MKIRQWIKSVDCLILWRLNEESSLVGREGPSIKIIEDWLFLLLLIDRLMSY